MIDLQTPPTEQELDRLDQFLYSRVDDEEDDKDEGIVDVSELDGFLTAIVSGPNSMVPSQWLPVIWGDYEPAWKDEQEFMEIFSLMMRQLNCIVDLLMQSPQDFQAIFQQRNVDGKTYLIVDEWCQGYMKGVGMDPDAWLAEGEEMYALLAPILSFTTREGWEQMEAAGEQGIRKVQQAIEPSVREIHAYWLARRAQDAGGKTTRYKQPRIGRNDPCSCGSGKKYKKCCMVH